jgi:hypothetical protein
MQIFLEGLTGHYRNLLVSCSTGDTSLILESENVKQKYRDYLDKFTQIEIINSLKLILQTEYTFKYSSNQRTLIEALLVELIKYTDTREISQILEEIKELKSGKGGGESKVSIKAENRNLSGSGPENIPEKPAGVKVNEAPERPLPAAADLTDTAIDLNSHWLSIKDQIKTERKWVYSIIKDTTFEQDEKSNYILRVDDGTYELVDGYRDYLSGKISKYFGTSLTVNLMKSSDFVSSLGGSSKNGPADEESTADNYEKLRAILIKDFKAKEVN